MTVGKAKAKVQQSIVIHIAAFTNENLKTAHTVTHYSLLGVCCLKPLYSAMQVTAPLFSVHTGTSLCFDRLQRCSQVAPALRYTYTLVMLVKHCKESGGTCAVPWRVYTCTIGQNISIFTIPSVPEVLTKVIAECTQI